MSFDDEVEIPELVFAEKSSQPTYTVEPDLKKLAVKYAIIGLGQGGSRLSDSFYQLGYRKVVAINTTSQDFLGLTLPAKNTLVLGSDDIGGAGKDPSVAEKILNSSKEDVFNLMRHSFGEDVDRILVTAGLGGGSGSGFLLPTIELAKKYLKQLGKPEKVGILVTLPKKSEGGRVQSNAVDIINKLQDVIADKSISPLMIADNESIYQMFPDAPTKEFWNVANKNTVGLFDIFNILAAQQSAYVTFDKADYETMLDSGVLIFGATKLDSYSKDTDLSDGLRNNLKKSLLADVDIQGATHIGAIICASDKILGILPQSHIDRAFETLERLVGGENRKVTVHQGVYETKRIGLYLYTIIGGLQLPKERIRIMANRAGL